MLEVLTPRELEVACLIAIKCMTSKEAARLLQVSFRTIEVHRGRILTKLNMKNIAELARYFALIGK